MRSKLEKRIDNDSMEMVSMKDVDSRNCLSREEEQKWREIHKMESWKYRESCSNCNKRQHQIVKAPQHIEVEVWCWTISCYACKKTNPLIWTNGKSSGFIRESIAPNTFKNYPLRLNKNIPYLRKDLKLRRMSKNMEIRVSIVEPIREIGLFGMII